MNVLSLFDGMSCGQIALERAGIEVDNYFASEIDKHAIKVSKDNYPDIVHLGDVTHIDISKLPKIDLLLGGSPCQGFSNAGKGLNFDDPRSKLFFEYVRILKELKPKWFLLENVKMKKDWCNTITEYIGVQPVLINSASFSAQNRQRLYWTNIPVGLVVDKGIKLKDILLDEVDKKYYQNDSWMKWWDKNKEKQLSKRYSTLDADKSGCMTARQYASWNGTFITIPEATKKGYTEIQNGNCFDGTFPDSNTRRGRNMKDKCNCLTAAKSDYLRYEHPRIRRLTPVEAERLQTVPDNYTSSVSDTQRYKMLGNGWTVDVIAHIFNGMFE